MIDFHSHILPGIDDGSRNTEMTGRMLAMEGDQGVQKVVATPHFYASSMSFDAFLSRRKDAVDRVRSEFYEQAGKGLPRIIVGAEVYYFPGMGRSDLSALCIEGTNLLMLEMPFAQWNETVLKDVTDMIRRQKLKVILAHVERYYRFQKKRKIWDSVFELPVIAQFNAGCLTRFRDRRLALKFMKEDYPVILGSDCHNMSSRSPNLDRGRAVVLKMSGQGKLDEIDALGAGLLEGI